MMNKIYLFCLAVLTVLVTACGKDEETLDPGKDSITKKICFDSDVYLTRADGEFAVHDLLNNELYVIGQMTKDKTTTTIFDNKLVTYNAGWSYENPENWDFDATRYDFVAYSKGIGNAIVADGASINGFTINGERADLLKFFFTDKVGVNKEEFGNTVNLAFNQLVAKVRLEFYESIDGYTVKDLTFRVYTESKVIPNAGPYAVTFDSNNKPVLTHQPKDDKSNMTNELSVAQIASDAISDNAASCSSTDDCLVLPMTAPSTKLKIEVKYKSVKTEDNTETEVTKTGVLANSIDWKYLHRYIYKLQITDAGLECVQYSDSEWDNDYRH